MKIYKFRGKEYTEEQLIKEFNPTLSPITFRKRINQGESIEYSIGLETDYDNDGFCKLEYMGKKYKNVAEVCREFNINSSTFLLRRRKGFSFEECLGLTNRYDNDGLCRLEYKGKKYKNIKEVCKEFNVNEQTFTSRRRMGLSFEECISSKRINLEDAAGGYDNDGLCKLEYNGKKYKNVAEVCREFNISPPTFLWRRRKGLSFEECVGLKNEYDTDGLCKLEYNGKKYKNVAEVCREFNVNSATFLLRRRKGLSFEECIASTARNVKHTPNSPLREQSQRNYELVYRGTSYSSAKDLAKALGCSEYRVYKAIERGEDIDSLGLTRGKSRYDTDGLCKLEYNGKSYASIAEVAREFNVDPSTFTLRRNKGLSFEECISQSVGHDYDNDGLCKLEYNGKKYKNIAEVCREFNISQPLFTFRREKGLSFEECIAPTKDYDNDGLCKLEYNGKKYKNVAEVCEDFNINPTTFRRRREKGLSFEDCVCSDRIVLDKNNSSSTVKASRREKDEIVYRGTPYPSSKALSIALGYPDSYVSKVIERGGNIDLLEPRIETNKYETDGLCKLEYNGKKYTSIAEVCREFGVDRTTFRQRRERGLSFEECIWGKSSVYDTDGLCRLEYNGKKYKTISAVCKEFGVNQQAFTQRRNKGLSFEECISPTVVYNYDNDGLCKLEYNGKKYTSIAEVCREFGVEPATFKQRRDKGLSFEECIAPVRNYDNDGLCKLEYNGKKYNSVAEVCKDFNISPTTFRGRREKGLSFEECIAPKKHQVNNKAEHRSRAHGYETDGLCPLEYNGKKYNSVAEVCRDFDIKPSTFIKRRNKGLSFEECISYERSYTIDKYDTDGLCKLEYNGKRYDNIAEVCREFKLDPKTFRSRRNKGLSFKECIAPTTDGANHDYDNDGLCKLEYNGKKYSSITEVCKDFPVKYQTFKSRRDRGLSFDECIRDTGRTEAPRKGGIMYRGTFYPSAINLSESLGYTKSYVSKFLERGGDVDSIEPKLEFEGSFDIDGVHYSSDDEYFKVNNEYGISYELFCVRRRLFKLPPKDSLGVYSNDYNTPFYHGKVHYRSLGHFCKDRRVGVSQFLAKIQEIRNVDDCVRECLRDKRLDEVFSLFGVKTTLRQECNVRGISIETVTSRLDRGYSKVDAIVLPVSNNEMRVVCEGVHYKSLNEFLDAYKLSSKTYYDYANKGYTVGEIVDIIKAKRKKKQQQNANKR